MALSYHDDPSFSPSRIACMLCPNPSDEDFYRVAAMIGVALMCKS
jgi:hypothetical protein